MKVIVTMILETEKTNDVEEFGKGLDSYLSKAVRVEYLTVTEFGEFQKNHLEIDNAEDSPDYFPN